MDFASRNSKAPIPGSMKSRKNCLTPTAIWSIPGSRAEKGSRTAMRSGLSVEIVGSDPDDCSIT